MRAVVLSIFAVFLAAAFAQTNLSPNGCFTDENNVRNCAGTGDVTVCNVPPQDVRNWSAYAFRFPDASNIQLKCYGASVANLILMVDCNRTYADAVYNAILSAASQNIYGFPPVNVSTGNPEPDRAASITNFFNFLQFDIVEWIPIENQQIGTHLKAGKSVYTRLSQYYFFMSQPSLRALQTPVTDNSDYNTQSPLSQWMVDFVREWGGYLDRSESFPRESFVSIYTSVDYRQTCDSKNGPVFNMSNYMPPASGYKSFNQWFARQVRPGMRPVAALDDATVLTAPADTVLVGQWPISADGMIAVDANATDGPMVKGVVYYNISQFLKDVPAQWQNAFNGGTFVHAFLNTNDYHRLHTLVNGTVLYNNYTKGAVWLNVTAAVNGIVNTTVPDTLSANDQTGWQFYQDRGILIQDSPLGVVATCPMGMAQVSGVFPTAPIGSFLRKGQEFSYFFNGGSDIVLLFQKGVLNSLDWGRDSCGGYDPFTGKPLYGHKLQGQNVGTANLRPDWNSVRSSWWGIDPSK